MNLLPYDHIAVEGVIGSGKTSLARILSEHWGTRLVLEEFDDNPFLPKFYAEPDKFAFPLELSFLAERYHQKREMSQKADLFNPKVVSDYILAKSLIFARQNLRPDEFELFSKLFSIINHRLPKPDLLIFLHCSPEQALKNIEKRGRVYERSITSEYLEAVNRGYLEHFRALKAGRILIIDNRSLDFVNDPDHRSWVIGQASIPRPTGVSTVAPPFNRASIKL